MLFTPSIQDLVRTLEHTQHPQDVDELLRRLLRELRTSCANPKNQERYRSYSAIPGDVGSYPVDQQGYAVSFDALTEEKAFYDCWKKYGVVVGKQVLSSSLCQRATRRLEELTLALSDGACDLRKPETWNHLPVDAAGTPLLTRGFFEVYHDAILAELRQSIRVFLHHVLLWGKIELWTSFDRFGIKLPHHGESKALPLHTDQNPLFQPNFQTIQGLVALVDCPLERGTFACVPGSKFHFLDYKRMAPERGEYLELDASDPLTIELTPKLQPFPLRAGDLVSWDSRTTHANTENISDQTRMVALIAAGPAQEQNKMAKAARAEAFQTGLGSNVREALMHASKKPRYTDQANVSRVRHPESLTLLGKLLYGQTSYNAL